MRLLFSHGPSPSLGEGPGWLVNAPRPTPGKNRPVSDPGRRRHRCRRMDLTVPDLDRRRERRGPGRPARRVLLRGRRTGSVGTWESLGATSVPRVPGGWSKVPETVLRVYHRNWHESPTDLHSKSFTFHIIFNLFRTHSPLHRHGSDTGATRSRWGGPEGLGDSRSDPGRTRTTSVCPWTPECSFGPGDHPRHIHECILTGASPPTIWGSFRVRRTGTVDLFNFSRAYRLCVRGPNGQGS